MSVTVRVDPVRCAGHGLCVLLLSERVDLDEWGFPVVSNEVLEAGPPTRRARRAARACPRQALLVVDRQPDATPPTVDT